MGWKSTIGVFLLLGSFVNVSVGQSATPSCDPDRYFSQEEMRADFSEWRSILESDHPGLYRFTPQAEMASAFDRVANSLDHPMNQLEFLKAISPMLGFIKDGHTRINPAGSCRRFIHEQAKQFPLQLRFASHHAYVVRTVSSASPRGAEILSINGESLSHIQEVIECRLPRDGNIETGLEATLSADFSYYYYLYVGQPATFRVTLRNRNRQFNAYLDALTESDAKSQSYRIPEDPRAPLAYRDLGNKVAYLRISTFSESDIEVAKQNFADFLKESFAAVRSQHIHNLIIDLRGNSGGDNYGPLLFSYLHRGSFPYFKYFEARTNDLSPLTPLRDQPVSEAWNAFVGRFQSSLVETPTGEFRATTAAYPELAIQPGQSEPYGGTVWFLIDGGTFSAAAEFCAVARSYRRGIFVGEETGGDYYGNSGVEAIGFPLRYSRLAMTLPLFKMVMAVHDGPPLDRGILPDLRYRSTVENNSDRDAELDFVLRAISKQRAR